MDKESSKRYVKEQLENYLQCKGIDTHHSFRCLNPAHTDHHPSMSIDRTSKSGLHCKCFACGAYYDTFDLIGIDYGLTDKATIFNKAYEIFNLNTERKDISLKYQKQPKTEQNTIIQSEVTIDFTDIVKKAHKELMKNNNALAYLQSRGFSMKTITAYELGYDEAGYNHFLQDYPDHQSKSSKARLYRYIFPYPNIDKKYTYFLAEIEDRTQIDSFNGKYRKIRKGNSNIVAQIFNERYLQNSPPVVFICEGICDALSVEEVGGKAIAFGGIGHNRFINLCKKYKPDTTFIISLDNDETGQKFAIKLKNELNTLKIPCMIKTAERGKDFNEDLQTDKEAFMKYIHDIIENVGKTEEQIYLQTSVSYQLQSFMDDIVKSKTTSFFSTGFVSVDNILDGGIYAGLYCIGAISSLGKTSFCLQIADNIAKAGQDVLIFSLEMDRNELVAKSISRLTFLQDLYKYQTTINSKTTRDILTGSRYENYNQIEKEFIMNALEKYRSYADHIFIHEGIGNIGVEQIREVAKKHKRITGKSPVILIDYIQILAPYNEKYTDKQNMDKAILELKRISRDYSTAVIGISSFNRANYTNPVNMASFKESGAIEFSADVLIGLQYDGMDYNERENEREYNHRIKDLINKQISLGMQGKAQNIQVKILKNRNGSKGSTVIEFYPMFNCFVDKKQNAATVASIENSWIPVEI